MPKRRAVLGWAEAASDYLDRLQSDDQGATSARIREFCLYPEFLRRIAATPGYVILDAGCGEGWLCRWMADNKANADIYGLDLPSTLLQTAEQTTSGSSIHFVAADLEGPIPFPDETFDLVVANLVIHWLRNLEGFLSEMHRVSCPGGHAILTVQHPYFGGKIARWDLTNPDEPVLHISSLGPKEIETYIDAHSNHPVGPLAYQNRSISDYFRQFSEAGFCIVGLQELLCKPGIIEFDRSWIRHVRTPAFLMFVLRKPTQSQ